MSEVCSYIELQKWLQKLFAKLQGQYNYIAQTEEWVIRIRYEYAQV